MSDPASATPADYDGDDFEDQDRPIAYHRWHARLAGSVAGGVFLSQAIYWARRTKNEGHWFYKTKEEWADETGLTRSELDAARARLKNLGVLEERHRRLEARLYYRINFAALRRLQTSEPALPKAESGFRESDIQLSAKAESDSSNKVQRIPETTSKTTTPPTPSGASAKPKPSLVVPESEINPHREPAPNPGRAGLHAAVVDALCTLLPEETVRRGVPKATRDAVTVWFTRHYKPALTPEMVEYARLETGAALAGADSGHVPYMLAVLERCMADPHGYAEGRAVPPATQGHAHAQAPPTASAQARAGGWPPAGWTWERGPDGSFLPWGKRMDGSYPYGASSLQEARKIDNQVYQMAHDLDHTPTPEEVTAYVRTLLS